MPNLLVVDSDIQLTERLRAAWQPLHRVQACATEADVHLGGQAPEEAPQRAGGQSHRRGPAHDGDLLQRSKTALGAAFRRIARLCLLFTPSASSTLNCRPT